MRDLALVAVLGAVVAGVGALVSGTARDAFRDFMGYRSGDDVRISDQPAVMPAPRPVAR